MIDVPFAGAAGGVDGPFRATTLQERSLRRHSADGGKKRAIVAVGNSVLIIWHLLSNPDTCYHDLGPATTTGESTNNDASAI